MNVGYVMSEEVTAGISILRCEAAMLLERAEFFEERNENHAAKEFKDLRAQCCLKIESIVVESIEKVEGGLFEKIQSVESEMYPSKTTLGEAIKWFSVHWGSAKDTEFYETLFELEEEINICIEMLEEKR